MLDRDPTLTMAQTFQKEAGSLFGNDAMRSSIPIDPYEITDDGEGVDVVKPRRMKSGGGGGDDGSEEADYLAALQKAEDDAENEFNQNLGDVSGDPWVDSYDAGDEEHQADQAAITNDENEKYAIAEKTVEAYLNGDLKGDPDAALVAAIRAQDYIDQMDLFGPTILMNDVAPDAKELSSELKDKIEAVKFYGLKVAYDPSGIRTTISKTIRNGIPPQADSLPDTTWDDE